MIKEIEIRKNARKLVRNMAPLVGCKLEEKEWSPRTGVMTCKGITIASLLCIDINEDLIQDGYLEYHFDPSVTIKSSNIYKQALNYSPIVLNPSYVLQAQSARGRLEDTRELLYMQSLNPNYNDSAIYNIFEKDKSLRLCPYYKHVLLILLESFSLRWTLYDFSYNGIALRSIDVQDNLINKLARNIEYVKYNLEKWDVHKTVELNHHLSTLLMNVLAVKYDVTRYYLEVDY